MNAKFFSTKNLLFLLEFALIALLISVWFSSETLRQSKNLWVLFLYNFPSQFLISFVPHEPVLLYFSKFYNPITVMAVCLAGTVIIEFFNYQTVKFVFDFKNFEKVRYTGFVKKVIDIFNRTPFLALCIAGIAPIPFYPFRFLVALANYPLMKYLLTIFLSRIPRFFLLAWLGHTFKVPDYFLLLFFSALVLISALPLAKTIYNRKKKLKLAVSKMPI